MDALKLSRASVGIRLIIREARPSHIHRCSCLPVQLYCPLSSDIALLSCIWSELGPYTARGHMQCRWCVSSILTSAFVVAPLSCTWSELGPYTARGQVQCRWCMSSILTSAFVVAPHPSTQILCPCGTRTSMPVALAQRRLSGRCALCLTFRTPQRHLRRQRPHAEARSATLRARPQKALGGSW